jgi:hypothetical protein
VNAQETFAMPRYKLERDDLRMRQMHAMMDRLDVDIADAARARLGGAFHSATRTCQACPNGTTCSQWLQECRDKDAFPSFCPNAGFFLSYRRAAVRRPGAACLTAGLTIG